MKKILLTIMILTVAAAGTQTLKAGDRAWAITGKVLTEVAVASAINHAIVDEQRGYPAYYAHPAPCVSYNYGYTPRVICAPPVYCAQPVAVYPAPVYFAPRFGRDYEHFRHNRW